MYHPKVIEANLRRLEESHPPPRPLRAYSVEECAALTSQLEDAVLPRKKEKSPVEMARPLTPDEHAFIANELILTKVDFRYWAERYCVISLEGAGVGKLFPLWTSQELLLAELARLELENFEGSREDGILIDILKARQLGASTFAQGLAAHRATTQGNLFGLIASDVPGPEGSGYLFNMLERVVENLPWWLAPAVEDHVKDTEISFDSKTHVWVGAGKSMKGSEGRRGQLGRGKTITLLHLSELSTWDDPQQIDGSLLPTVPLSSRVLALFESTGKGRNNWWHKHWDKSCRGLGRFTPVFIPWYAEEGKYRRVAPEGWVPSPSTLAHARRAEEHGPRWMHKSVSLTKEQLYWYETTRATYEADDDLTTFLEEYSAEPEEAFQFSGRSIFPATVIQKIQDQAKPLLAALEISPLREIEKAKALAIGDSPPLDCPPGYGLKALTKDERRGLENYEDLLQVWELPRKGQLYIVSVDVSDGIGQDRSCIDVLRKGTILEPDEQVAQFVSGKVHPVDLAYPIDAIGRFYLGSDSQPAVVAIEINNQGLATQSELQRHLDYDNLFIWQYEDAADPSRRLSTRIGWLTTPRTRPMILTRYIRAVKTFDEHTGKAYYVINSPFTIAELRDFQVPPGGFLAEAEADPTSEDATDDCIMCGAIGVHVAQTLEYDNEAPLPERRAALAEQAARRLELEEKEKRPPYDWRNSDASDDEMRAGDWGAEDPMEREEA